MQEDEVLFHVHEITPPINDAINLLQKNNDVILAKLMSSDREEKIRFSEVLYVEYIERQIFLYTKEKTYLLRQSLINFINSSPEYLIQVSKNTLVNVYEITAFTPHLNGNLTVQLSSTEKLIVSRRYVSSIRNSLKKIAR
ncbi:LytTR family DNA-binding domain-containing protein [Liquorilactobacillus uvarum]|uniref:LytTR family DNA-binding domain-containing protein n=2 Tax=Liquorilactobacillus uvarum TaxID=303240 RepID=UPI002889D53F|nr:LytTR family DNA-binding domain-containing protein [Liquorilactobacillus uvarum]